jgi:predicted RNA-binding protein with PUA-like domain
MDEIISYKMCAVKVRNAKLRNYLNSFHIGKFMFSYHNQLLPPSFLNLFITNNEIHDYNTRNASSYRAHACRTNVKQFHHSISRTQIVEFTEFVKSAQTINCFRNRILKYLLDA